jgi:hypothetical protein
MRPWRGFEADEADEMFEADEADEADEAAPRGWRPLTSGRNLMRQRSGGAAGDTSRGVSQAQLNAAIAGVNLEVRRTNSAVSEVRTRLSQTAAAVRRETTDRRNETGRLRNNLSQTQQLTAILPLLNSQPPGSVTVPAIPAGGAAVPQQTIQVTPAGTSSLSLLLPLLLFSGIGDGGGGPGAGGTGGGGLFGGGDSSQMTTLVLVLALAGGGLGR